MYTKPLLSLSAAAGLAALLVSSQVSAAPFGADDDVAYAKKLWHEMTKHQFAGKEAIAGTPYIGVHPHGTILDTIDGSLKVGNNTGDLIVKRNYGGEGVSKSAVADQPDKYLDAVTVMYRRAGYDADNQNWFWVKYKPDGSLHTNPAGIPLAGRVAKGAPKGCIACHAAAPGGDLVFNHDKFAAGM